MPPKTGSASAAREISACRVEVSPAEVDAGAEMTLKGTVACSPAADLAGTTLSIRDQDGAPLERMALGPFDGESNETAELVLKAPREPGTHTWFAVYPADEEEDATRQHASPFSFTVKAHSTGIVVWDTPSAVEGGASFRIKLGLKCSSECRPSGWAVEVLDHDGERRARATLSDQPWTGTAALYYAEVALSAPEREGLFAWQARSALADVDIPHSECGASFGVRVTAKPECLLTVVALDREQQTPVKGAKVVVHPFRAFTDERGVAELRVPKGAYRIFVSGKKYCPFRSDGDLKGDLTIKAELVLDQELSDADVWS